MTDNTQADFFLPADLVARALASLAEQCDSQAAGLEAQPQYYLTRDERAMPQQLRCEAAKLRTALEYWQSGCRPILMADGSYLIASRSGSGALFHTIRKVDGRWVCGDTCPQHAKRAHVHQALMLGIERAMEMADEEDDGTPLSDDEIADQIGGPGTALAWQEHEAEQRLWTRLALARAAAMEFNSELFAA